MKQFSIFFLSCMIFNSALADSDGDCGSFHVQISNLTSQDCVLTSQRVIHGNLITPPPMSILSGDSKRFDMLQTPLFGPEILLSYQCGEENITFTSQQNLCVLHAGNITGTILPPDPIDISANYLALPGSYFWGRSGSINWRIV